MTPSTRNLARPITLLAALACFAATAMPAGAQQASDTVAPEAASGTGASQTVRAERQMVAAANPLAAQAGLDVLRDGGSAADALVAVQAMLGLVEPQSSGLGGGAFLVWYDAETGAVTTYDGRETAPMAADGDLFLGEDGDPLAFFDAVVGGRSVGTPGVPRLLEAIHAEAGKLDWDGLFDAAIERAGEGFAVSPRLASLIAGDAERLGTQPTTRAYFMDAEGKPLAEGATLRNPAYAETLAAIARDGADAFYEGGIAAEIVSAVRQHQSNPGLLTQDDLAAYRVIERDAVCQPYRGHDVCGMGPPSSGGLTVAQILSMVEPYDLATLGPENPESWRIIGDATRLAFADRGLYMADADFVKMPEGLTDHDYLLERSRLLDRPTALPEDAVVAGEPPWERAELRLEGSDLSQPATSHMVIVDDAGNVASMTSSVENAFGARLMAGGMLLNNQLTDFSFRAEADGEAVANRVEPGKRPRSSMSPTIVLRDGKPVHALGSPGGATIIPFVANTLIALIDWDMDMQAAFDMPHRVNPFGTYVLEAGTEAENHAEELTALGFDVVVDDLNSGLHGVSFRSDGSGATWLEGAADPRREGLAVGD